MQVVKIKCFLLNHEKNWRRSVLSFSRKAHTLLISKNDVNEPKVIGYSNNQLAVTVAINIP